MRRFRSESTAQCYERNVNGTSSVQIRRAQARDAARIAEIFNQVLADRVATFETRPATPDDVERWIAEDIVVVAERGKALVGWAKAGPYTDRHYYDGVREATLYVAREARRTGVGQGLLKQLAVEAAGQGAHKLVGKVFSSNDASIALLGRLGWREVGVHRRHGELDGEWKDVLVVERLLEAPE
jgi:L-amino acid N-acyltransferase YncA